MSTPAAHPGRGECRAPGDAHPRGPVYAEPVRTGGEVGGPRGRRTVGPAAAPSTRGLTPGRPLRRVRAGRPVVLSLVACCAGLALAGPALAQAPTATAAGAPSPGLLPVNPGPHGYFEFTLGPGAHRAFAVVVKNLSSAPAGYSLYVSQASTGTSGGVAYSEQTAAPTGTASWLQVPAGPVTLRPGQNRQLILGVTVPTGTAPGDYVAAIAADSPSSSASDASTGSGAHVRLTVSSRVVVAVVIHVPGPLRPGLRITQPAVVQDSGGRQILDIGFVDDGNELLKPLLEGTVTACSGGAPVVSIHRQLDTFVPRTSVTYTYSLAPTTLAVGCYRVALQASFTGGALGFFRGTLTVSPLAAGTVTTLNGGPGDSHPHTSAAPGGGTGTLLLAGIGVIAALLIAVLGLLLALLRRRRPPHPG